MKGIVDRIEGDIAIVEVEGEYLDFFLKELPLNISEGDIIELIDGEVKILEEETKNRTEYINDLFNSLIDDNSN